MTNVSAMTETLLKALAVWPECNDLMLNIVSMLANCF